MTIKIQLGTIACVAPHYVDCTFDYSIKVISGEYGTGRVNGALNGHLALGGKRHLGTWSQGHSVAGALGGSILYTFYEYFYGYYN